MNQSSYSSYLGCHNDPCLLQFGSPWIAVSFQKTNQGKETNKDLLPNEK
jgi:hypothetical protein